MDFAERYLRDYRGNLERLEALRAEYTMLTSMSVTNYRRLGRGGAGDPVWQYVQAVMDLEAHISRLRTITEPITAMVANLEQGDTIERQMAEIFNRLYVRGEGARTVCLGMGISRWALLRRQRRIHKSAKKILRG